MTFTYRCLDKGKYRDGLIDAASSEAAVQELKSRGWEVLLLSPAGEGERAGEAGAARAPSPSRTGGSARPSPSSGGPARSGPTSGGPAGSSPSSGGPARPGPKGPAPARPPLPKASARPGKPVARLTLKERSLFFLQLSTLVRAGITYDRSLACLADSHRSHMKTVCTGLGDRLLEGWTLSSAVASMPAAFLPLHASLIQIGERTGGLVSVLDRLAEDLRREELRRSSLMSALVYPVFIMLVSAGMVAFLVTFMLPRFLAMFADLGTPVPWPTRALMVVVQNSWLLLIPLAGLLLFGLWWVAAARTPAGRMIQEKFTYDLPGTGALFRSLLNIRLARSLALMLNQGLTANTAVRLLADPTCGCQRVDESLRTLAEDLETSGEMGEAFLRNPDLPLMFSRMVSVGETVGRVGAFLERYAELADTDLDHRIRDFLQLLEPLMLGSLGLVVGGLVLVSLLPLYQLITTL